MNVSDCWAAYNNIANLGYQHLTVNHTYNFVDPITHAHTNNVENFWMCLEVQSKKERGTKNDLSYSYMIESVWHQVIGDPFKGMCGIKDTYLP